MGGPSPESQAFIRAAYAAQVKERLAIGTDMTDTGGVEQLMDAQQDSPGAHQGSRETESRAAPQASGAPGDTSHPEPFEVTVSVDTYGTVYVLPEMQELLGLGAGPCVITLQVIDTDPDDAKDGARRWEEEAAKVPRSLPVRWCATHEWPESTLSSRQLCGFHGLAAIPIDCRWVDATVTWQEDGLTKPPEFFNHPRYCQHGNKDDTGYCPDCGVTWQEDA